MISVYSREVDNYGGVEFVSSSPVSNHDTHVCKHKFQPNMRVVTKLIGGRYEMERCGCNKEFRAHLRDCNEDDMVVGDWEPSKAEAERSLFDKLAAVAYGLLAPYWGFPGRGK